MQIPSFFLYFRTELHLGVETRLIIFIEIPLCDLPNILSFLIGSILYAYYSYIIVINSSVNGME